MKPIRYASLLVALLSFSTFSLNTYADISYAGQLQQELVSWDESGLQKNKFRIRDGGEYQLNSHDVEGASYLALFSTFRLTPNHQGLARLHFDLSQEERLEQYEAYIGIQMPTSSWRIGSLSSPYKSSTAAWDPFLATFMQARGNGGASIHHNGYIKSSIAYQSSWWSTKVALLGSTENGASLSLVHSLTKWDFALAYHDDQSGPIQNSAVKFGLRYRLNGWFTAFQHESLKESYLSAQATYLSISKQNGKTEYGGNIGMYRSDDSNELDINYFALGMKHALAKHNIVHFGYRMSSTPNDSSQSENAFGIGFRYSF